MSRPVFLPRSTPPTPPIDLSAALRAAGQAEITTPLPNQGRMSERLAIRTARRYLRANEGALARLLNAHDAAQAQGKSRGKLAEQ